MDWVDLKNASELLAHAIARDGVVLYEHDPGLSEQFRQLGFITSDLAAQLALSAGFRNILAHVYEHIEPEMAYRALQLSVVQYPQYIQQIQIYLNSLEEDE